MNIGFISVMAGIPWGGSEELWAGTARLAKSREHSVLASVYAWPQRPRQITELASAGIDIHTRPLHRTRWERLLHRMMPTQDGLSSLTGRLFDVLCISQGGSFDLPASTDMARVRELTKDYSIPYVVVCQFGAEDEILSPVTIARAREFFAKARAVCFVSERNRIAAERHVARTMPNARVVLNPVNLTDRTIAPWPTSSRAVFCNLARMDAKVKGQDALLQALSFPRWKDRDWELRLCGQGADEAYLKLLAANFGITDRVIFCGQVQNIRDVWRESHLLLMPSRAEGTPLAMVEAMLCGRPAVVTDVGGNAEWITEGDTGFIAPACMPEYLDAAMERAWNQRDQWQSMGLRCHELASQRMKEDPAESLLQILLAAAGETK